MAVELQTGEISEEISVDDLRLQIREISGRGTVVLGQIIYTTFQRSGVIILGPIFNPKFYSRQMIVQPVFVQNIRYERYPVTLVCPGCHNTVQSRLSYEMGQGSWLIAIILLFFTGQSKFSHFTNYISHKFHIIFHKLPSSNLVHLI